MFDFTILGLGHLALASTLTLDILLTKHRPVSAVLWLAVVWAFPYGGALAYLSIGVDRVRRGAASRQAAKALVAQRAKLHPTFDRLAVDYRAPYTDQVKLYPAQHIFRATDPAVLPNRVFRGNRAELLVDGEQYYPSLFEAIASARSSVHLQTFIIGRDHVGRELLDLLVGRAKAGVECRLLYDRFGSTHAHLTRFFEEARRSGVHVCSISQANPFKGRFQINLRNHRKTAVIDGHIGYVGGLNLHHHNLSGRGKKTGIRDYHVRIEGPAVSDIQIQFIEDWHFASRESPDRLLDPTFFPEPESVGNALIQIVPGGPDMKGRGLADAVFGAIVAADKSITIVTPYFVPDEPLIQGLRYAALRGVHVKLVVPRKSNHWYTEYAARSLYSPLLKAGIRIFERGPPFMHAKALLIDDVYAMLGSANLDYRSLHLNFETNVEISDDDFLCTLRQQIDSEIEKSMEVALSVHQNRSLARRLTENFCYLFQPML